MKRLRNNKKYVMIAGTLMTFCFAAPVRAAGEGRGANVDVRPAQAAPVGGEEKKDNETTRPNFRASGADGQGPNMTSSKGDDNQGNWFIRGLTAVAEFPERVVSMPGNLWSRGMSKMSFGLGGPRHEEVNLSKASVAAVQVQEQQNSTVSERASDKQSKPTSAEQESKEKKEKPPLMARVVMSIPAVCETLEHVKTAAAHSSESMANVETMTTLATAMLCKATGEPLSKKARQVLKKHREDAAREAAENGEGESDEDVQAVQTGRKKKGKGFLGVVIGEEEAAEIVGDFKKGSKNFAETADHITGAAAVTGQVVDDIVEGWLGAQAPKKKPESLKSDSGDRFVIQRTSEVAQGPVSESLPAALVFGASAAAVGQQQQPVSQVPPRRDDEQKQDGEKSQLTQKVERGRKRLEGALDSFNAFVDVALEDNVPKEAQEANPMAAYVSSIRKAGRKGVQKVGGAADEFLKDKPGRWGRVVDRANAAVDGVHAIWDGAAGNKPEDALVEQTGAYQFGQDVGITGKALREMGKKTAKAARAAARAMSDKKDGEGDGADDEQQDGGEGVGGGNVMSQLGKLLASTTGTMEQAQGMLEELKGTIAAVHHGQATTEGGQAQGIGQLVSNVAQTAEVANTTLRPGEERNRLFDDMSSRVEKGVHKGGKSFTDRHWYLLPGLGASAAAIALYFGQKVWKDAGGVPGIVTGFKKFLADIFTEVIDRDRQSKVSQKADTQKVSAATDSQATVVASDDAEDVSEQEEEVENADETVDVPEVAV